MQKLSVEETAKAPIKAKGRLAMTPNPSVVELWDNIKLLYPGESVKLLKSEWPLKSEPSASLPGMRRRNNSNMRFSCFTLEDNLGWIIKRTQ